jgi:hypothetical protein
MIIPESRIQRIASKIAIAMIATAAGLLLFFVVLYIFVSPVTIIFPAFIPIYEFVLAYSFFGAFVISISSLIPLTVSIAACKGTV